MAEQIALYDRLNAENRAGQPPTADQKPDPPHFCLANRDNPL
jgi:hypothetical protein